MIQMDTSILHYFWTATPIIKIVLLLLLAASAVSWFFIFERRFFFRDVTQKLNQFEKEYASAESLFDFYQMLSHEPSLENAELIFVAGTKAWLQAERQKPQACLEHSMRAMQIVTHQIQEKLEKHLSFLATVGSTSPYVGLFGTVWGIMMAFQALGVADQATIAMVAPGISEALVATALGLFAAIPAVIAYNRYTTQMEILVDRFSLFQTRLIHHLSQRDFAK